MKCDSCGEESSTFFKPDNENKVYCSECKQKAEQEGTASWLPKNDPRRKATPSNFPWLWIILAILLILGVGLTIYFSFGRKKKRRYCRYCGEWKWDWEWCPPFHR